MAQQQVDPAVLRFGVGDLSSERLEPASGIDHEQAWAHMDLDAAGMATVDHGLGTGHGERSARAPKANRQISLVLVPSLSRHGRTTVGSSSDSHAPR